MERFSTGIVLDEIEIPIYETDEKKTTYPYYVAVVSGENKSLTYESAPPGQVDHSAFLGAGFAEHLSWSCQKTRVITLVNRNPQDWKTMKMEIDFVAGNLSPFSKEEKEKYLTGAWIPAEIHISGAITDVDVADFSRAIGVSIAGYSTDVTHATTKITGYVQLTDPFTSKIISNSMATIEIRAEKLGGGVFNFYSIWGHTKFYNIEAKRAIEIATAYAQMTLADYLIKDVLEKIPEEFKYQRFHYRSGLIKKLISSKQKQEKPEQKQEKSGQPNESKLRIDHFSPQTSDVRVSPLSCSATPNWITDKLSTSLRQ